MFMLYKKLDSATEMVDAMESLRDVVAQWPDLQGVVYTFAFLFWEGFAVIQHETIRNVVSALLAVGIICLFLLADLVAAGLVVLMIICIDVCLLGSMHFLSLDYNSVTAINIVLGAGEGTPSVSGHRSPATHAGCLPTTSDWSFGGLQRPHRPQLPGGQGRVQTGARG